MARCNQSAQIAPVSDVWRAQMDQYARIVEAQYGLPASMLSRMMALESRYDPAAFNPCTEAVGILQQRPIFVRDMGARFKYPYDPLDPKLSIIAAAKYLTYIYRATKQSGWDLPLVAYNFGEGNMRKFVDVKALQGRAMLPKETVRYIATVQPDAVRV